MINDFLKEAKEEDSHLIFNWANEPTVRAQSINTREISWEEHENWFKKKLESGKSKFYILYVDEQPVGQVRFDLEDDAWLINYSVDKNHRKKGYGKKMITEALKKFSGETKFKAFVKPDNQASIAIFASLKFNLVGKENVKGIELLLFIK